MGNPLAGFLNKVRSAFTRNDKPAPQPTTPTPVSPVRVSTPTPAPTPQPHAPLLATSAFHSTYFKLSEFYYSATAVEKKIDNMPPPGVVTNLNWLCQKILDPLRQKLERSISISSGYRSSALNAVIGGVNNSQHSLGQAADISAAGMTAKQLFEFITKQTTLPYDQVIQEFERWVHISFDHNLTKQRGQKLIASSVNGKTVYKSV